MNMNRLAVSLVSSLGLILSLAGQAPGQVAGERVPVTIRVTNKAGAHADSLKIQAWLVVNPKLYAIDLGGDSPAEFRQRLERLDQQEPNLLELPPPSQVDMTLVLKNVGTENFSFKQGPGTSMELTLEGAGAVTVGGARANFGLLNPGRAPRPAPMLFGGRNDFIRPGQTAEIPIRALQSQPTGARSYWTEPGDYTVKVLFTTALDDMYGRIHWDLSFESAPVRITVGGPGAGGGGGANPRQNGFFPPPSLPPAAVGLESVDPRDWKVTAGHLREILADVQALYKESNPRARETRLADIQEYLDKFIGAQVEWSFPLEFSSEKPVGLFEAFQPPPNQKHAVVPARSEPGILVQMATEPQIPGVRQARYNPVLDFRGTLPMLVEGKDIPNREFASLRKGAPITVRGKLERICVYQFFNPPPSLVVLLSNVTTSLENRPQAPPFEPGQIGGQIPSYEAVALNQILSDELKASGFAGKTIEVSGTYNGTRIIPPAGNRTQDAYEVTFQGYAGLAECSRIKCLFFDRADLPSLNRGDPIRIRGVVTVKGTLILIVGKLVR